jgi:hypothetical protein
VNGAFVASLPAAQNAIRTPEEGFRVLLVAVIHQATLDATGREKAVTQAERERRARSALAYFHSPRYLHHCQMLGIAPKLPPVVADMCGELPPPPEPEPEPEPEVVVGDLSRPCVICGHVVRRRRFNNPPERTTCGDRTCSRMLSLKNSSLTAEAILALHRRYVLGEPVSEMRVEGRDPVADPGYVTRLFRAHGLPTRGRNGRWRDEDIPTVLSLHDGLTPEDVAAVTNGWHKSYGRGKTAVPKNEGA